MTKKKTVRRVWEGKILISDRIPGGKLPIDNKFLPKSEIQKICKRMEKGSGYANSVTVSIVGMKIALVSKA